MEQQGMMIVTHSNYPALHRALFAIALTHSEMTQGPLDETTFSMDYTASTLEVVNRALEGLSEDGFHVMCELGREAGELAQRSLELRRARSVLRVFAILTHEATE